MEETAQKNPKKVLRISPWALTLLILAALFSTSVTVYQAIHYKEEVATAQSQYQELNASLETKYEFWDEKEQQDATAIASGVVTAYLSDPGLSLTKWRTTLADYGTAEFQSWTEKADPSFRPRGHILTIQDTIYTESSATVDVATSAGVYRVELTREGDDIRVKSLAVKGG